jgi:hypothetical protein
MTNGQESRSLAPRHGVVVGETPMMYEESGVFYGELDWNRREAIVLPSLAETVIEAVEIWQDLDRKRSEIAIAKAEKDYKITLNKYESAIDLEKNQGVALADFFDWVWNQRSTHIPGFDDRMGPPEPNENTGIPYSLRRP